MIQALAVLAGLLITGLALSSLVFASLLLAMLVLPLLAIAAETLSGWWSGRHQRRGGEHPEHAERFLARAQRIRRRLWEAGS